MDIRPDDHLLFYGDSITACGRDHSDPAALGHGYVNLIAARLLSQPKLAGLRVTNRGIGGNRVYDLETRLDDDVLAARPTIVSILVGINDTWRNFDKKIPSPIELFQKTYAGILDRILAAGARVVILEPFVLPIPADRVAWRADVDQRITAIRELAWERKLPYLPLDGIFAAATASTGHAYWLPDGVHPSLAGHSLIAEQWVDRFVSKS